MGVGPPSQHPPGRSGLVVVRRGERRALSLGAETALSLGLSGSLLDLLGCDLHPLRGAR